MRVVNTPYKQYTTAELAADYIGFKDSCRACYVVSYYGSVVMLSNRRILYALNVSSCTLMRICCITLLSTYSAAHCTLPLLIMYAELCSLF
jgi:hypothetical protein